MLGEAAFEDRKAHARQRSQFGHTLRLVVVVADKDAEIVLGLNHRLEEIGMLGRRVKHLDHHKELRGLHPVEPDAVEHLPDCEKGTQEVLDGGMHRKRRNAFGRDHRIVRHHLVENILLAELDPVDERQYDHMGLVILSGSRKILVTRKTHALLRSDQPHRIGAVLQFERSRHDKKNTHHAVRRKGHPLSCRKGQLRKPAVGRVADTAKRRRKRRTTTTIRSTTIFQ